MHAMQIKLVKNCLPLNDKMLYYFIHSDNCNMNNVSNKTFEQLWHVDFFLISSRDCSSLMGWCYEPAIHSLSSLLPSQSVENFQKSKMYIWVQYSMCVLFQCRLHYMSVCICMIPSFNTENHVQKHNGNSEKNFQTDPCLMPIQ